MKRLLAFALVLVLLFTLLGACTIKTAEKSEKEETEETQSSKTKDKDKNETDKKDKDEEESEETESSAKSGKSGLGSLFGKKEETETSNEPAEQDPAEQTPAEQAKPDEEPQAEPEKPEEPEKPAEPEHADSVIRIGYDEDYPPFTYTENGEAAGFDVDLAKAVCEKVGLTPEFVPMPWENKEVMLAVGDIDCVWSAFPAGYGDDALYIESVDYYNDSTVLITAAGSGIQDQADISSVAVLNGEKTEHLAGEHWSDVRVFAENEYDELCQALMSGEVDAVAVLFRTAVAMYGEYYDELYIFDDFLYEQYYCVAFYIDNTELREKIDQGLQEVLAGFEAFSIAYEYDLENGLIYYD